MAEESGEAPGEGRDLSTVRASRWEETMVIAMVEGGL